MNTKIKNLQNKLHREVQTLIEMEKDPRAKREAFIEQYDRVSDLRARVEKEQVRDLLDKPTWRDELNKALGPLAEALHLAQGEEV